MSATSAATDTTARKLRIPLPIARTFPIIADAMWFLRGRPRIPRWADNRSAGGRAGDRPDRRPPLGSRRRAAPGPALGLRLALLVCALLSAKSE